jgi:tetrahydromethanopterin S-methyltransferase subunit G
MANNTQKSSQTIKQEREARRLEKVEAFKKQQARERRNRRIGIISGVVGGLAVLALIVTVVVVNSVPKPDPATITIEGLQQFPEITGGGHVDINADGTPVTPAPNVDYQTEYGMNPPAGGNHWQGWLNCGVYSEPQQNERAVHSLEHGAVWVTYDPEVVTGAAVDTLVGSLPDTYVIVSPYPDLPAPVIASAWGAQVQLEGVNDSRLNDFVNKYWLSPEAPEPGALCSGAIDGPGKVS